MSIKELRQYQLDAINSIASSISKRNYPVGVIFPGGGKSVMIAEITRRILAKNGNARVLMLVDTKELVQQNYIEFCDFVGFRAANVAGIYSAGLGRKEDNKQVLFASVQSYVNCVERSSPFDFIIIDECHLVPTDNTSQYKRVLNNEKQKNPKLKWMGFTGTPWRMDMKGTIANDTQKGGIFNEIACDIGCRQLIDEGYLSPIISYEPNDISKNTDLTGVEIKKGDFDENQATRAFMRVLPDQVAEILEASKNNYRKKWLVFCQSREHAIAMFNALSKHISTEVVFGNSPDRDKIIDSYRKGQFRALVNVKVLAKGINIIDIDKVVLCFATKSVSDYIQKVGRVMRIAPGKKDGLVLDFGGNIARHGPVDQIDMGNGSNRNIGLGVAPMKQCPECGYVVPLNQNECDICGHRFPELVRNQGKDLTGNYQRGGILSNEAEVIRVSLMVAKNFITKKNDPCVVIDFYSGEQDRYPIHQEFLNLWNKNEYAVKKSWESLSLITDPEMFYDVSESPLRFVDRLNDLISNGVIATPSLIFLRSSNKNRFKKLIGVQ